MTTPLHAKACLNNATVPTTSRKLTCGTDARDWLPTWRECTTW